MEIRKMVQAKLALARAVVLLKELKFTNPDEQKNRGGFINQSILDAESAMKRVEAFSVKKYKSTVESFLTYAGLNKKGEE
jgi:hypothetical protein